MLSGRKFVLQVVVSFLSSFTLLVGRPPFDTPTLKETFGRIKKNEYHVPSSVSTPARNLINRMLQQEPERRPDIEAVLNDDFMLYGECTDWPTCS